jgi:hypothetical protein
MGNKIKMTESKLISMIERVIAEQASAAGFGYGFVREVETAPTTPLSAQERELSWGKLRELMKDFYINYKEKFGDVQPNEFNEIEMILLGIIDMARVKNINGKDPDVIAQYLKQHMKRLPAAGDPDVDGGDAGDTPPQPRDAEVKKMFENRLRRTLVNEQSSGSNPSTWGTGFANNGCPPPDEGGPVPQSFANNIGSGPTAYALWANWITQNKPNWGCRQLENRTNAYSDQMNTNMANSNGDGTGCSPKWNNMLMAKIVGTRAKGFEMGCGE